MPTMYVYSSRCEGPSVMTEEGDAAPELVYNCTKLCELENCPRPAMCATTAKHQLNSIRDLFSARIHSNAPHLPFTSQNDFIP